MGPSFTANGKLCPVEIINRLLNVKENGELIVFEIKSRAVAPMRYDLDNY